MVITYVCLEVRYTCWEGGVFELDELEEVFGGLGCAPRDSELIV